MTVQDLIIQLQNFPPQAEINLPLFNGEFCDYDNYEPIVYQDLDSKKILIVKGDLKWWIQKLN